MASKSKGFIVGSVLKNGTDLSTSKNPHLHSTYDEALTEAKRLLSLSVGGVDKNRKLVILEVKSYVDIVVDPFLIQ